MVKIRKTKGRRIRQKDSSRQAVGPMLSSIYETSFLNKTSHNSLWYAKAKRLHACIYLEEGHDDIGPNKINTTE